MPRIFRRRRLAAISAAGLLLVAGGWFGTPLVGRWLSARAQSAGRLDEAITWLERLSPGDAGLDLLRARQARRSGEFREAARLVESAERKGFSRVRCDRERILIEAQKGNLAATEPYLAGLLRDPRGDAADINEAFATGLTLNMRVREAEPFLDRWIAARPDDHRPLVRKSRIVAERGDLAAAEQLLRKAFQLSAAEEVGLELGDALLTTSQPEAALEWFDRCRNADPPRALVGRAKCLRSLHRPDEARQTLQQLLSAHPGSVEGLLEMGRLEVDEGAHKAAVAWLERALKREPWNRPVQLTLISALRGAARSAEADALQQRANAAQQALVRGSTLLDELGKRPADPQVRFELGQICLEHDDPREAVAWLHSAVQLAPNHAPARELLERARAAAEALPKD